jgi:tetratricopeptide (TPR) repeat protein
MNQYVIKKKQINKFYKIIILLLLTVKVPIFCGAAERITIAIINPNNLTGDTNLNHWQLSIPALLENQLRDVGLVRILPYTSINYAVHELQLNPQRISQEQAIKIGEIVEARYVIYGTYLRHDDKWTLTEQLANVTAGVPSKVSIASSKNLFQVVLETEHNILLNLAIFPTKDQNHLISDTNISNQALEFWSRAYAGSWSGEALPEILSNLQGAVSDDPRFTIAQLGLAHALLLQGNTGRAFKLAKQLISDNPNLSEAHYVLGTIYMVEDLRDLAETEFLEAIRLCPDNIDCYSDLAQIYFSQSKSDEAVSYLKKAEELAPCDPSIHALLGCFYPSFFKNDLANTELQLAEHYDTGDDIELNHTLAVAYQHLNNASKAVEHYEKYIIEAKTMRMGPLFLEQDESALRYLKASLTTNFIPALKPRDYTSEQLRSMIRQMLTNDEYNLIVVPFESTPEIGLWADHLTGDATNSIDKAKLLFDGLTRHVNINQETHMQTAKETFRAWADPKAVISCQDYAYLYMAMARHLGLKAYYVLVTKDYSGRYVSHACVGVFINDRVLLVDPAYVWFGVPHKEYEIESDLRVVGLYMCEFSDDKKINIGLHLVQDWPLPHFLIAVKQAYKGQMKEAIETLNTGLKYDSTSWMALYAEAMIEMKKNDWNDVVQHLQSCVALDPDFPNIHYSLGKAFQIQGKLNEARVEYRKYLEQSENPEFADEARLAIASINEALSSASSR